MLKNDYSFALCYLVWEVFDTSITDKSKIENPTIHHTFFFPSLSLLQPAQVSPVPCDFEGDVAYEEC